MPPLPQNGNNYGDDPYYTEEDIAILHGIVVRAQNELSHLPERDRRNTVALFNVYDEILPTLGLDAVHDNRYAPILFKIGGMLGEGTLYDKFETVLKRMGIEIEIYDGTASAISENAQETQYEPESLFDPDSLAVGAPTPQTTERRRRYSESAVEDVDGRAPDVHTTRSCSDGSLSNTNIGGEHAERSVSAPAVVSSPKKVTVETRERRIIQPPRLSSRQENRALAHSNQHIRIRRDSRSTYDHGFDHETISSSPAPSAEIVDNTQQTARSGGVQPDETGASTPVDPPKHTLHLPETFLDMRAQLFYQRQSAVRATDILKKWNAAQERQRDLAMFAENHDWKTLVYASFKAWRSKTASSIVNRYRMEQQEAEKERQKQEEADLQNQLEERERYLEDLETQAAVARDQFVLKTILNRWNESAIKEIQQTLAARRQILGRRYFNAWRELAASNEEKVRTHVLKKFLTKWRERNTQIHANHELAISYYEDRLVQRNLWEWWESYGCAVIHRKQDVNIRRKYLTIWLGSALDVEENEHMALQFRRDQLVRKVWAIWRARAQERRAKKQAKLDHIQSHIDHRLVRRNFILWLWLTRKKVERRRRAARAASERQKREVQATAFYQKQVLKEALMTWRYRLRSELVVERVNRNTVAQTMCKLVLESRLRQFQRIKDARLKQSTLQLLIQKRNALAPVRLENERIAKEHAAKRSQNVMLRQWLCQMHKAQQRQKAASDFYESHLVQGQLDQWTKKLRVFRRQQEWARDAEFFLATTKAIKVWKAATQKSINSRFEASEAAKRERLYNAYSQTRRKHKIRLAGNIVQKWREKADAIAKDNRLALQVRQNRSTVLGMEIFDRWRARTEDLAEMKILGETKYEETMLRSTLQSWEGKLRRINSMHRDADAFYSRHVYAVCGYYIKEWSRRGFQIRAKENQIQANEKTAEEYRERCLRAAYRKTLRRWRTLTLEKRQLRGSALDIEPPGSIMARKSAIFYTPRSVSKFNTTAQAEEWTAFDGDIDNADFNLEIDRASASTPAPSSMRTPLRKSGILAPFVRGTTTPKTPLATPFERRLREEYSAGQPFGKPKVGKSGLSKSVGFADLPDKPKKGDLDSFDDV